jgi:hypothetical protein
VELEPLVECRERSDVAVQWVSGSESAADEPFEEGAGGQH